MLAIPLDINSNIDFIVEYYYYMAQSGRNWS